MSSGGNAPETNRCCYAEGDREALRVEFDPRGSRTQLEAAWLIGRLCNELRFRCQDAWLSFVDREPIRTAETWANLSLLVSDALPLDNVDAMLREIQELRNIWDRRFRCEDHSEELGRDNDSLKLHLYAGIDLPQGLTTIEFLIQATSIPTEIADSLHTMFLRGFPAVLSLTCQLGYLADQVIHPPYNLRAVQLRRNAPIESELWTATSEASPVWIIDRQLEPNASWPDAEWETQIIHVHTRLFRSLGLSPPSLPARMSRATSADILDEFLTHIQDADVQDTVDAQPEVAESNSSRLSRRGERKCRQLGITIDSQRMVVTRAYCDADLAPRLFRLFLFFLNRPEEAVTTHWLAENWILFSQNSPTCRPASVHSAIGALNSELAELQVEIRSEGAGYILDDFGRVTP
ncbi:MAG: hypothetical protein H6822_24075 [Planctomycetaceae bacterium]|nr:hypothetical protein [Planctomycetales bacterium]MCB9925277.1 hypothetical protein [Planctomycetaceae bacterium]